MMRLLSLFLYYFRWQRIMTWVSLAGAIVMLLYFVFPPSIRTPALIAGGGLALGFPLSFAGISFRQLISNRRFALVPRLRMFAAAALLLLTLAGALTVCAAAISLNAYSEAEVTLEPVAVTLLAFTLISAYVLISQWLVVYSMGLIGFVLLPLVAIRVSFVSDPLFDPLTVEPLLLVVAVCTGWIWLFLAMRRPAVHRSLAAPHWGAALCSDPASPQQWHPDFGPVASPAGALMRGFRDGLRTRLAGVALGLLFFPVAMLGVLWILGAPLLDSESGRFPSAFFLLWSLFGIAAQSSMLFRNWPARLRYLWLRRAGDRAELWRFADRALLNDLTLVGVVASVIALAFMFITADDPRYLIAYVACCVALTALTSYFGFLSRASGWHSIVDAVV
ncbi:MAG TPA: hypothetical protein VKQ06_01410, partial [Gammaproteobacteria bacterium]|nr:hypothetical protein [Gammaproteobacteria bacterium]